MTFNQDEIAELLEIVDYYHTNFVGINIGKGVLSKKDKALLQKFGIILSNLPEEGYINHAYKFGVLAQALGDKNTHTLNYNEFKKYLRAGKFYPLTVEEKVALDYVLNYSYSEIKGLGNRISRDLQTILIEVDQKKRQKLESQYKEIAEEAIRKKWTVQEFASALGHKTGEWNRDLIRVSDYIMHWGYESGRAEAIKEQYLKEGGSKDPNVYKITQPTACNHCNRLYLTNGKGSQPRVFKLSQLVANGSNVGRKVPEWKATLGSLHPYCRCVLQYLPDGYIWDQQKQSFIPNKNFVRKVQRKSKIQITIGDKKFEV